jgi:hypothetical protein
MVEPEPETVEVEAPPEPSPNRAGMRGGSSVVRAHGSTIELEKHAVALMSEHPGRVAGFVPTGKPEPGSTPWESRFYVNARQSADGHAYRKGETVSEAEAGRQGLLEPPRKRAVTPRQRKGYRLCPRCEGRGTYSKKKPKGHAEDCGCRFCGACPACGGSRYERQEA